MTCVDIKSAVDLQTPSSIRQLNWVQVPHHLFLPGLSQRDLGHVASDQETWSTEMVTHAVTDTEAQKHWCHEILFCILFSVTAPLANPLFTIICHHMTPINIEKRWKWWLKMAYTIYTQLFSRCTNLLCNITGVKYKNMEEDDLALPGSRKRGPP